jgi:hypothetical protein
VDAAKNDLVHTVQIEWETVAVLADGSKGKWENVK